MTEGKRYQIERVRSFPYLNEMDELIDGFSIRVRFTDYDEIQEIKVPNTNPETVRKAVETRLQERDQLTQLG